MVGRGGGRCHLCCHMGQEIQDGRGCVGRKTLIMSAANLAWSDPILYCIEVVLSHCIWVITNKLQETELKGCQLFKLVQTCSKRY